MIKIYRNLLIRDFWQLITKDLTNFHVEVKMIECFLKKRFLQNLLFLILQKIMTG